MRNMSFALTTQQIRDRTKTVTRRFAWWNARPGWQVMACVKCMGLKKGEKIERLTPIELVDLRGEPLSFITKPDCILEGFPDMEPAEYIEMILKHNPDKTRHSEINRIEFKYLE